MCWHPAHAHRMKDRLLEALSLREGWDVQLWRSPLAAGGRGAVLSQLPTTPKCSRWQSLSRHETREWGAGKRVWGSLLLQRQRQEEVQPALSLPGLWLCQPCPLTRPITRGHRSRSGVPTNTHEMLLDVISQSATDSTAGLAGSITDKRQVGMGGAKGALPSSGTLTDGCCSLLGPDICQVAAGFKHLSAANRARLIFSCRTLSCCLSPRFPCRGWLCAPVPDAWTNTRTRLRVVSSSAGSQGRRHRGV